MGRGAGGCNRSSKKVFGSQGRGATDLQKKYLAPRLLWIIAVTKQLTITPTTCNSLGIYINVNDDEVNIVSPGHGKVCSNSFDAPANYLWPPGVFHNGVGTEKFQEKAAGASKLTEHTLWL